jgi:prevent-host-death family protein
LTGAAVKTHILSYLRKNFSELVARAEAGEKFEITRRGKVVARFEPLAKAGTELGVRWRK